MSVYEHARVCICVCVVLIKTAFIIATLCLKNTKTPTRRVSPVGSFICSSWSGQVNILLLYQMLI